MLELFNLEEQLIHARGESPSESDYWGFSANKTQQQYILALRAADSSFSGCFDANYRRVLVHNGAFLAYSGLLLALSGFRQQGDLVR
jgi:hypothetical protein